MQERSYLFVPGNRPERFAKACESPADVVIIDLEDAVSVDQKVHARESVSAWLSADSPVYVRINGTDTEWFEGDLAAVVRPGLAGVVLPKAETREQMLMLANKLPAEMRIVPIIETALGVWNVLEIAKSPKVERLAFGSVDMQLDIGCSGDNESFLYSRSSLVLASRIAGILPPLDGVTVALDDAEQLLSDIQNALKLGFGGKLCIHPKQAGQINNGFLPGEKEVEWAKAVVKAVEESGDGAVRLGGNMIDRPVIERARRVLLMVAQTKES